MSHLRAYADLTGAMVIVGSSVAAGKLVLVELPVFTALAIRFVFACLVALPVLYAKEGGLPRLGLKSWGILGLQAFCGVFAFNAFLLYGLKLTDAASAGIITSTTPAVMGVLAWLLLREILQPSGIAGIALSVAGILVLTSGSWLGGGGSFSITGNLLVLMAVISEAFFLLLRKTIREPLTPYAMAAIMSAWGLVFFAPPAIFELGTVDVGAISSGTWAVLGYYGAFISVVAYFLWFRGIVDVPASTAGVFTAVMPLSAIFFSALLLGEAVTMAHMAGCALVLAGILLISGFRPMSSRH